MLSGNKIPISEVIREWNDGDLQYSIIPTTKKSPYGYSIFYTSLNCTINYNKFNSCVYK